MDKTSWTYRTYILGKVPVDELVENVIKVKEEKEKEEEEDSSLLDLLRNICRPCRMK